ncbi:MAG: hypothetical protein ACYDCH_15085, partial [Gaiellaceae bacterium]
VQKKATPTIADTLTTSDGAATISWPAQTFGTDVEVTMTPQTRASLPNLNLPPNSIVVDVRAFIVQTNQPVSALGQVVDLHFPNAPGGTVPQVSEDGMTWRTIPALPTLNLPDGQRDGWFRDSDGTLHVLTRHFTYYALVGGEVASRLTVNLVTVRRLWLEHRTFLGVRVYLTAPARLTGTFVDAAGKSIPIRIPGTTTRTRPAGTLTLRVPLASLAPGTYRLELRANGLGQLASRTAKIRILRAQPKVPVWQSQKPIHIAAIQGVGARTIHDLSVQLGSAFWVDTVSDANLYRAVDPTYRTAAAAAVVELGTVPLYTLSELHALLPELQIVGVTNNHALAARAISIGVSDVLPGGATGAEIGKALTSLLRGRQPTAAQLVPAAPAPSTRPVPATSAWPAGTSGWTAVLRSVPVAAGSRAASAAAQQAGRAGLPRVGVLRSSDYGSLRAGYYVVFSGVYATPSDAARGALRARAAGFADAYPDRVAK